MTETGRSRSGQGGRTAGRTASGYSTGARSGVSAHSASGTGRGSGTHSGTGASAARTGYSSHGGAASRRRKYRRKGPDFAKIILIVVGLIILVLCVAVGMRSCGKDGGAAAETSSEEETTTEPETEIEAEITVNGVSIHGLTKTEALEKVLEDMDWSMKVQLEDKERELPNFLESQAESVIDEALGKGEAGDYTVDTSGLDEAIAAEAASIASEWNVAAKNGSISSYDASTDQFVFSGAENGKEIDQEQLVSDIKEKIEAGEYQAVITAIANEVEPDVTEAEAKENFKRLGTFTTTTTSNKNRNENIRIASSALNGMIIQPGETFSFNQTTGNRTAEKGYRAAGAYQNGVLVEEPGGGVCQVSSTLYNAVVFAGLKTTERHAHSYEPSYVTPGEDAMVSYDGYSGPDMKFINNSKSAVAIKTSFSNQKLTISIYGYPILEDGVTLSMHSEKVKELDPPTPTYEEDQTLEPGVEKIVKAATPGSRWVTNLVTKKDGVVVSDELLHTSTYSGKAATIKRNTSGTVLTSEGESTESGASEESTTISPEETTESAAAEPGTTAAPAETTAASPAGPGHEASTETVSPGPGQETTAAPTTAAPTTAAPTAAPETTALDAGGTGGPGSAPTTAASPAETTAAETQSSPGEGVIITPLT